MNDINNDNNYHYLKEEDMEMNQVNNNNNNNNYKPFITNEDDDDDEIDNNNNSYNNHMNINNSQINIEDQIIIRQKKTILQQLIPSIGDYNAVVSIFMDNLANFAVMIEILVYGFNMPRDLVTKYFIPGPAFAVMIGSLLLSAYAMYLDYIEKDPNVLITAIPLGLDTPTTIGLPILVIGPVFLASTASGMSEADATYEAWLVGCATVFLMGILKLILSVLSFTTKQFHPAGKTAALAGIGLALLGLNELPSIFEEPVVGWTSLWILLLVLLHRQNKNGKLIAMSLPFNLSGVLVSCVVGTILYYFMTGVGISVSELPSDVFGSYYVSYPHPSNLFKAFVNAFKQNMAIIIPYSILVNISSVSVIDGANSIGNEYKFRWVLLIDAFSTIVGSLFGSATQTTPYIGHSVFHNKFKAGSSYSTISGLLIGLGGFFGYLGLLTNILPKPAIIPIFIFIAFEICHETLHNTKGIKPIHSSAIIWAFLPALFQFTFIVLGQVSPILSQAVVNSQLVEEHFGLTPSVVQKIGTIMILANGFICTALFWGTALAYIIDNRLKKASIFLALCSVLTFFGVIHSVDPNSEVYLPWKIDSSPTGHSSIPYHWAASYLIIAIITYGFSFFKTHEIDDHHHNDDNNGHNQVEEQQQQQQQSKFNFKFWKKVNSDQDNQVPLSNTKQLHAPLLSNYN